MVDPLVLVVREFGDLPHRRIDNDNSSVVTPRQKRVVISILLKGQRNPVMRFECLGLADVIPGRE
jgi:hypothetical protein